MSAHLILFIIFEVFLLGFTIYENNKGNDGDALICLFGFPLAAIVFAVYGGIYWW